MNDKQLFAQYAALKSQIKTLEAELEPMKEQLLAVFVAKNADEIQTEFGTFTYVPKRSYTYTTEIINLEETLKEKKKQAEAVGTATYVIKPYVLFKETKLD